MLVNTVNGKRYIGQTRRSLRERMTGHKNAHKYSGHGSRILNNAIRKYGWSAFKVVVLGRATVGDELDKLEAEMISKHGTQIPGGYNILEGAANAPGANEMVKAKRAETMKRPEPRAAISEGVKKARANCSEEERREWVENVRLAQTTPEFLELRAQNQRAARNAKTAEELAEWNRKSAEGMQARAAKQREEKLKGMTEEEGKKWLAKCEATRVWREKNKDAVKQYKIDSKR